MGERLAIDFVERLRDTHAFASKEDLVRQLESDVAKAKLLVDQGMIQHSASGLGTMSCDPDNTCPEELSVRASHTARVLEVLKGEVQPALGMDDFCAQLVSLEGGVARLRWQGNCADDPCSIMAIMMEVEKILRRRIPEIQHIEIVP